MSEVGTDVAPVIHWPREEKKLPEVQDNGKLAGTTEFFCKTHKISKHATLLFSSLNILFIQYFYKY